MKLVHFLVGSLVASVASAYTIVEPGDLIDGFVTAFSGFATTYNNEYMYRGMILGLQEDNTDTSHTCYLSYLDMETIVLGLSDYFTNMATEGNENSIAATLIDNVWYRPATYFKLIKKSSEMGQLFFVIYSYCYFDNMIISVGRTINSFAGGFNTAVTSLTYALNLLDFTDTTNPLVLMYSIVDDATYTDAYVEEFGL